MRFFYCMSCLETDLCINQNVLYQQRQLLYSSCKSCQVLGGSSLTILKPISVSWGTNSSTRKLSSAGNNRISHVALSLALMVLVAMLVPVSITEGGGTKGRRKEFIGYFKLNARSALHKEEIQKQRRNKQGCLVLGVPWKIHVYACTRFGDVFFITSDRVQRYIYDLEGFLYLENYNHIKNYILLPFYLPG